LDGDDVLTQHTNNGRPWTGSCRLPILIATVTFALTIQLINPVLSIWNQVTHSQITSPFTRQKSQYAVQNPCLGCRTPGCRHCYPSRGSRRCQFKKETFRK
jgi:hypothetical protein